MKEELGLCASRSRIFCFFRQGNASLFFLPVFFGVLFNVLTREAKDCCSVVAMCAFLFFFGLCVQAML